MAAIYIAYSFLSICIFGCSLFVWRVYFSKHWPQAALAGHSISWLILLAYMFSRIVVIQRRADLTALITEGLSTQNKIQAGITLVGLGWVIYLILARKVKVSALLAGPGFWISFLILVYAASSLWSVWPALTVFRVLELGVFWVIAVHIFAKADWFNQVERFLWATVIMFWLFGFLSPGAITFSEGNIVGAVRSNHGSTITAVLIIWTAHRLVLEGGIRNFWKLLIATFSLIVFGSLASTLALLCALSALAIFYVGPRLKPLAASFFGTIVLMTLCVLFLTVGELPLLLSYIVDNLSTTFGKTPENILTWTGRLPLWTAIWEATKDQLWGFGFAAAERVFGADRALIGWAPGNAHSGYVSGWFGAGWIGLISVLLVFAALWIRSNQLVPEMRPLIIGLLVLLAVNNLTMTAIGGRMGAVFMFVMALACTPSALKRAAYRGECSPTITTAQCPNAYSPDP